MAANSVFTETTSIIHGLAAGLHQESSSSNDVDLASSGEGTSADAGRPSFSTGPIRSVPTVMEEEEGPSGPGDHGAMGGGV